MRKGAPYHDTLGNEHMYFYVQATISNDSIIPAYVDLILPNGFFQPIPSDSQKFQAFFLPDSIGSEAQWSKESGLSKEVIKFITTGLDHPFRVNKVLQPNEECVINIGIVTETKYNLNPYFSIFSRGHKPHPWPRKERLHPLDLSDSLLAIPDSAIQKALSNGDQFCYYLGISFYDYKKTNNSIRPYCIIPCGQVTFSEN